MTWFPEIVVLFSAGLRRAEMCIECTATGLGMLTSAVQEVAHTSRPVALLCTRWLAGEPAEERPIEVVLDAPVRSAPDVLHEMKGDDLESIRIVLPNSDWNSTIEQLKLMRTFPRPCHADVIVREGIRVVVSLNEKATFVNNIIPGKYASGIAEMRSARARQRP